MVSAPKGRGKVAAKSPSLQAEKDEDEELTRMLESL